MWTCVGACFLYFEDGADQDGWSRGETHNQGSAGIIHGAWSSECRDVSKDIQLGVDGLSCRISFTAWCFGTIDGDEGDEDSYLFINDQNVWQQRSAQRPDQNGCNNGWQNAPSDAQNWGDYGGKCFMEVAVDFQCTRHIDVRFHSDLDEGEGNEGWRFSNVRVEAI